MLKTGDKVRFSNAYLKFFGPRNRKFKKRRAKQYIMTVMAVQGEYDWKQKKYNIAVRVFPDYSKYGNGWISAHWLRFVRRDT